MAGNTHTKIKLLDLAILLYHMHRAAQEQEIGFEDAQESIQSLTNRLNKTVYLEPKHIESALWSANLLDEKGKFWHPANVSFDDWVKGLVQGKYNRFYCTVEEKE